MQSSSSFAKWKPYPTPIAVFHKFEMLNSCKRNSANIYLWWDQIDTKMGWMNNRSTPNLYLSDQSWWIIANSNLTNKQVSIKNMENN